VSDIDGVGTEWVTVSRLHGAELVRLAGEIDVANAALIGAEIATRTAGSRAVLIDLTAVSFLDSAGVRLLDVLIGELGAREVPVRLVVAPTGPVRLTLMICAFRDDLLTTDLATAVEAVGC
jgi:anti-sigma B factor antagonist